MARSWAPRGFRGRKSRPLRDYSWEVWLIEHDGERLNARFGGIDRALQEKDWYVERGYQVEVRYAGKESK